MTFLEEVAGRLVEKHGTNFEKVALILPSKRASLFLKKSLAAKVKKTIWAPITYTFSDLVELYHNDIVLDKTSLSFELYEVYKAIEQDRAESFDQFYKWGEILLSDFNDIDLYLLDAKEVFRDLKNIHQLESWNVESYTEMQERYLDFWKKLAPLYHAFNDHLQKKGYTYSGAAYKKVALQLKLEGIGTPNFNSLYFCGLNAISPSELDIIDTFKRNLDTEVLWDMDTHYTDNPYHEAGHFYRQITHQHHELKGKSPPSNLDDPNKQITVYEAPSGVGQVKIASQILEEIAPIISHEKCAVVLPDPTLLIPTLQELPSTLETANVTMGFPLEKTEIFSLVNHVLSLQDNIRKSQRKTSIGFHFRPFLRVIKHPVLRSQFRTELEALDGEIRRGNKVFITESDLEDLTLFKKVPSIFYRWEHLHEDATRSIHELLEFIQPYLLAEQDEQRINLEALFKIKEANARLGQMLATYPYISQLSTFKRVFINSLRSSELSFYGEPVSGLQIMGLLETRALDFENLIILSMNEGVVPKGKIDASILPYDLKRFHNLPGTAERDSVMSNHFFRLIQRAKNVHIVYAPLSDALGSGEKSRFLLQIEQELKYTKLRERRFRIPLGTKPQALEITKDQPYYEQLKRYFGEEKGLSVSALNKFIRCPLDFYYTYVCGLKEDTDVEEEIEDSTMGQLVHEVLEDIYKPYIGTKLDRKLLQSDITRIPAMVETKFKDHLNQGRLYGKNYISKEIAITQVERVIRIDINDLKSGDDIVLLGTEEGISTYLDYQLNGEAINIKLIGAVDRIDKKNGEVRVIDYKTGSVKSDKVKPLNLSRPFTEKDSKPLQLAYYSFIYGRLHPGEKVSSWIFGIRNDQQVQFQGKVVEMESYGEKFRTTFESKIRNLIDEITDPNTTLQHNPDSNYCKIC